MHKLLIADLTNQKLRREIGGAEFSFPPTPHNATIRFGLRFSKQQGNRHFATYPTIREIRATVGEVDARPEAGDFSLVVGEDSPVLGTNLTTDLDWDCTAAEIEAALDALSDVTDCTVVEDDDSFLVTGISDTIQAQGNTLRPISFVRVHTYTVDGETTHAIRLQRAPLGFTDTFTQIVPNPPTIERLQGGGTSGDIEYPEIQQLNIPLEFAGSFQLRTSDGIQKSALLGVADGPEEIEAAINPSSDGDSIGLAVDEDGEFTVTEHPTEPAALIEFGGSMHGVAQDLLTVSVFSAPAGDYWGVLDLDSARTLEALRDRNQIRVPIEILADIEDDDDSEVVYENVPIYRGEITLNEAITHSDLGTASNIDWTEPPARKTYVPVSPDALSSGTRFYDFLVGDGSSTTFAITHSLSSPRCFVHLRENTAGGKELYNGTDYRVDYDDDDQLTITLLGSYASSPPATNALSGTVQDLTTTSTWLSHTHTIAEITNLQTTLDAFAADIAALKASAGVGSLSTRSLTYSDIVVRSSMTDFSTVYPLREPIEVETEGDLVSFDLDTLPSRGGGLLAAVHDTTAENVSDILSNSRLPRAADTYLNRVFTNDTGADLTVPGAGGRRTRECPAGGFVACSGDYRTGGVWYVVERFETGHAGVTFTADATDDEITLADPDDLKVGDVVQLTTTGTLPAGLSLATDYWILDDFQLATSATGSAIDITDAGTGTHTATRQPESTWYPVDFNRELFEFSLDGKRWPRRSEFRMDWALQHMLRDSDSRMQLVLVVEEGTYAQKTDVTPAGANISDPVWNTANPVLEKEIVVTEFLNTEFFGIRATHTESGGSDVFAAWSIYYGEEEATIAPDSATVAYRIRLVRADVEDSVSDPRGLLLLAGMKPLSADWIGADVELGVATVSK